MFYQDILGFTLCARNPWVPVRIPLAPQGVPTIALVTWFDGMKPGGLQGVMLNSTDLDGDHQLLSSRGCSSQN